MSNIYTRSFTKLPKGQNKRQLDRFLRRIDPTPEHWHVRGGSFENQRNYIDDQELAVSYSSLYAGAKRRMQAKRVAWLLFRGRLKRGQIVYRTCDSPGCVRPDHLAVGSFEGAAAARRKRKTQARGVKNGRAKLDPEKVRAIRRSKEGTIALSRRYGVDPAAIRNARNHVTWAHVK